MSGESIVEFIGKYLEGLDGIRSFAIASEGLPLKWSSDLSQDNAEELIALATDLISSASRFGGVVDPKESIVSVVSREGTIATLSLGDLQVVVQGDARVVEAALMNVKAAITNPIKCPHCGKDITLSIFKCPHCGRSLPLGLRRCPHCGGAITYLKCPHCGNPISPTGKRMVLARARLESAIGVVLALLGAGVSAMMYYVTPPETKLISVIPLIALGGLALYMFNIKELREEK